MDDAARHSIFDNKIQLYQRPLSPHWHCSCTVAGKQRRSTTKEDSLSRAKDVARDWYLGLLGKYRAGELKEGKTFKEAAERFIDEFETLTKADHSPIYIQGHKFRIKNHLNPYFGDMVLSEITAGKVQEYRVHRMKTGMSRIDQLRGVQLHEGKHKPPARNTLHQEIVCLRQVLSWANVNNWLPELPNLKERYKGSRKISHRAWFSLEDYRKLYTATRQRKENPPKPRWKWECEQLHDFVLFMANTGLRPDEAYRLEFRDVKIIEDQATNETILHIDVRGKRGTGLCKSMPGAVPVFKRLRERKRKLTSGSDPKRLAPPGANDPVFPKRHHELFNAILEEEGLKYDREGQVRTAYSLRHSYICFRLEDGADIYQIAKNCRTSVEIIQKYYASHIAGSLDTASINVRRKRSARPVNIDDFEPATETKSKRDRNPSGRPVKPRLPDSNR